MPRKVAPIAADASLLPGAQRGDAALEELERQASFRTDTRAILAARAAPANGRSIALTVVAFSVVAFLAFALFPPPATADLMLAPRPVAPAFPTSYRAKLIMALPYADLREPVEVWTDADANVMRVDYWNGLNTFYLNATGPGCQTIPVSDDGVSSRAAAVGLPAWPLEEWFPDLRLFTRATRTATARGVRCNVWALEEPNPYVDKGRFVGSYELFTAVDDGTPVRFSFLGHNTFGTGSHFDNYTWEYLEVVPGKPDPSVFALPSVCDGAPRLVTDDAPPGPTLDSFTGLENHHALPGDAAAGLREASFARWADTHGRGAAERTRRRRSLFSASARYVSAMNRKHAHRNVTYALNAMADWSAEERRLGRHGLRRSPAGDRALAGQLDGYGDKYWEWHERTVEDGDLKRAVDWRSAGGVAPIKDQGTCGSCWAFGTVAALEGALFVKTGERLALSEQALVDCSWPEGNNGCDGGEDSFAYEWMLHHQGAPSTAEYGPYLNADGACHVAAANPRHEPSLQIKAWARVNDTVADIMDALQTRGTLVVRIVASPLSFYFYGGGLYDVDDAECSRDADKSDHIVALVGYGFEESGLGYWILRNSWSVHWGEGGYMKIGMYDNVCGVLNTATYPVIEGTFTPPAEGS